MHSKNKNIEQDFNRKVWCILGLPFDESTFENTLEFIDSCIKNNKHSVLSTLSIDFINNALKDSSFRESIIQSDANIIDSTPTLWIAKFLGFPHRETVTGASLIQYLHSDKNKRRCSIFWFGGKEGVAEKAAIKTNNSLAIKAVGHHYPGFVPVKEMSTEKIIHKINKTNPNLLFANVISHVGAAMNFIAGDLKRAPAWMQKAGLEWLWRTIQEPKLCKRYFNEGIVLAKLVVKYLLPYKFFLLKNREYSLVEEEPILDIKEKKSAILIKIKGVCNNLNIRNVRKCFKESAKKKKKIIIDFSEIKYVDNPFLGLLLVLSKYQKINNRRLEIINLNEKLRMIFKLNLFETILSVIRL